LVLVNPEQLRVEPARVRRIVIRRPRLVAGDIARTVRAQFSDLLMGAYSYSRLRALPFASKTTHLLTFSTLPAILLR
jgi:hypothetical protein